MYSPGCASFPLQPARPLLRASLRPPPWILLGAWQAWQGGTAAGVRVWSGWRTLPRWWLGARLTVLRLRAFGSARTRSASRRQQPSSSLLPPLSGAKAAGVRLLSPLSSLGSQPLRPRLRRVSLRAFAPSFGRVCQPAQHLRPRLCHPAKPAT